MKKPVIALACCALFFCTLALHFAFAATPAEVTKPIEQFIDGFNTGNLKLAYASFAAGDITIVDEFAPHRWTGSHAPRHWAADYDKHAKATGVTEGKVTYGEATRIEVEGDAAYAILPTVYLYKEHGQPMQEEGEVTAVLHQEAGTWKMQGWTWSGVKPHTAK